MNLAFSLFAVALLILVPIVGAGWGNFRFLFGIVLPYAALAVFLRMALIEKCRRNFVPGQ